MFEKRSLGFKFVQHNFENAKHFHDGFDEYPFMALETFHSCLNSIELK
jgi:hypothetical protein